MDIIELQPDAHFKLGYPCLNREDRWAKDSRRFQDASIKYLAEHLGKDLHGVAAIIDGETVGHAFVSPLHLAGFPVRADVPDLPTLRCSSMLPEHGNKGVGRAMIESVIAGLADSPGLLVVGTDSSLFMPIQAFIKMGFQPIAEDDFWKIAYYPIQNDSVSVQLYSPELEWDYVQPFTFVVDEFCPFLNRMAQTQREAIKKFREFLPADELSFEEAYQRDENVVPGFYLFGKLMPPGVFAPRQIKKTIKEAIRAEGKKTFGTVVPSKYLKRK